ncbi:MAG TPA: hypothetical protein VF831_04955, partial [Anaerolineales bacterium]
MSHRRLFYLLFGSMVLLLMVVPAFAAPSFSSWGSAVSLESVTGASTNLNTIFTDGCPALSRDGLLLYFASNRPGGYGGLDIWVAERSTPD